MNARLVVVSSSGLPANHILAIKRERFCIGRAAGNDCILNDPDVSKFHAEVVWRGERFILRDLKSSNGTFVNDERIVETDLKNDDLVRIGDNQFRFVGRVDSSPSVTIVPESPIDRTKVLAVSRADVLQPASYLHDVETLRRGYDRIRSAYAAVQQLLGEPELESLCRKILEVTFSLVDADSGAVLLFDEHRQLVPWAVRNSQNRDILISRTIIDEVIQKRAAMLATDALFDSRWGKSESFVQSGLRSLMCVPLINQAQVYGILYAGNSTNSSAFAEGDLELVNGIGSAGGIALSAAFLTHRLTDEARTRESLGRFLSPVLLEQVLNKKVELRRGGSEVFVTVMFADIRGFTSLTERSRPSDVVELLNDYFDHMVEVIFHYEGVLDKFIGDAIMAVWGMPVGRVDDAVRASNAAVEMQRKLLQLNEVRARAHRDPIAIGIGLASGTCVSGAIGAHRRMEFTVIGDAVNLASRLASAAKPMEILCDRETYERAKPRGEELAPVVVKGKKDPVRVFRLTS